MEYVVVGWPNEGVKLRLDYERFAYAGKFVMSNTGKAVAREDDDVIGAVAFNADRTDPETAWLRYVTVAADRREEGIGTRLVRFVVDRLHDREFERVRIAVNNPFAYQALHKAGFGYTGEQTGVAELVLERPGDRSPGRYQSGLNVFREREGLSPTERSFLDVKQESGPPDEIGPS